MRDTEHRLAESLIRRMAANSIPPLDVKSTAHMASTEKGDIYVVVLTDGRHRHAKIHDNRATWDDPTL